MDNLTIREATPDDAAQIISLYSSAGIGAGISFTPEEAREHFRVFAKYPNYRVYVGVLGNEIVGCSSPKLHPLKSRVAHRRGP